MKRVMIVGLALIATVLLPVSSTSADTGGPDAGGYRFIDSDESGGPVFNYVDISATGTPVFPGSCDDCVVDDVPLGFPFEFYGESYTRVSISSNGVLLFGVGHSDDEEYENESIPTDEFEAAIMVFWDDLFPGVCDDTGVYYRQAGGMFITQWQACHYEFQIYYDENLGAFVYPDPCTIDVQVILLQGTNAILMQYADTVLRTPECNAAYDELMSQAPLRLGTAPAGPKSRSNDFSQADAPAGYDYGHSAAVGVQGSSDSGLEYTNEGDRSLTDGMAICFYPQDANSVACRLRRDDRERPPLIGAGLSGLFTGQPTPLPTAPAAVAPAATSGGITPPRTGDAGLASKSEGYGLAVAVAGALSLIAIVTVTRLRSKI